MLDLLSAVQTLFTKELFWILHVSTGNQLIFRKLLSVSFRPAVAVTVRRHIASASSTPCWEKVSVPVFPGAGVVKVLDVWDKTALSLPTEGYHNKTTGQISSTFVSVKMHFSTRIFSQCALVPLPRSFFSIKKYGNRARSQMDNAPASCNVQRCSIDLLIII